MRFKPGGDYYFLGGIFCELLFSSKTPNLSPVQSNLDSLQQLGISSTLATNTQTGSTSSKTASGLSTTPSVSSATTTSSSGGGIVSGIKSAVASALHNGARPAAAVPLSLEGILGAIVAGLVL